MYREPCSTAMLFKRIRPASLTAVCLVLVPPVEVGTPSTKCLPPLVWKHATQTARVTGVPMTLLPALRFCALPSTPAPFRTRVSKCRLGRIGITVYRARRSVYSFERCIKRIDGCGIICRSSRIGVDGLFDRWKEIRRRRRRRERV